MRSCGIFAEQIQLNPVSQEMQVIAARRDASYLIQQAEETACFRYRPMGVAGLEREASAVERENCLQDLRARREVPDNFPGNPPAAARAYRSAAFREHSV